MKLKYLYDRFPTTDKWGNPTYKKRHLIKILFRRNNDLELDNKYLRNHLKEVEDRANKIEFGKMVRIRQRLQDLGEECQRFKEETDKKCQEFKEFASGDTWTKEQMQEMAARLRPEEI